MGHEQRLTCADAMREFFAYLDRALSGESLEALEVHLEECLACCDKLAFARQLDAFIKARLGEAPLPPRLEERIRQALDHA
ncbi:MAG: zf-HC2 domain-containing protein [Candidatus Rokubacteria bacterium]|nr:zf-HC2 domain-containing protein [Candidatus Rokubacteria bacterium]